MWQLTKGWLLTQNVASLQTRVVIPAFPFKVTHALPELTFKSNGTGFDTSLEHMMGAQQSRYCMAIATA